MTVASIRYNNPGAMWGGNTISKRWGATANITLNDGLGQGNTIAFFPNKVAGASAQFDLWRSNYVNMTLSAAIRKWSGGNSSPDYIKFLEEHTGLDASSVITAALLASDTGWRLMKAQAQWEAGDPYPLTDAEWQQAQQACFSANKKAATKRHSTAGGIVVAGGGAAKAAHDAGFPIGIVIAIALFGIAVAALVWFTSYRNQNPKVAPPVAPPVPTPQIAAPPAAPPPPAPSPAPQPAPVARRMPTPEELAEKIKRGEL